MAVEGPQRNWSFIPGGTIEQYRYVKLSADNTVIQCDGVTDDPIGVSQDAATSTSGAVNVCLSGVTKLQGDADLAFGDEIGTSVDGQAAKYTVSDTTKRITGKVLIGNGAAGGLITAIINCEATRVLA